MGKQGQWAMGVVSGLPGADMRCGTKHLSDPSQVLEFSTI